MNDDNTLDPYQRIERSQAEHDLIRSLFNKQEDEPPPAWLNIRLALPLGDEDPINITEDDG